MKKKKWAFYFLYAVLMICYFIIGGKVMEYINLQRNRYYEILPYLIWSCIVYVIGGVIFGLERLLIEARKEGKWKVNWPKILFLGIPSLLMSIIMFTVYIIPIKLMYVAPFLYIAGSNSNFLIIIQFIFGYLLITSFYKMNKNDPDQNEGERV